MRGAVLAIVLLAAAQGAGAKDLGTHGPLFEIAEPSLLDVIHARLAEKEAEGAVEALRDEMERNPRAYIDRPRPVQGLAKAEERHSWTVDLSITVEEDLADHKGRVFARAGTVINPLDYSRFQKRIVLFDGDDPDQVAFALSEGNELDTLLVLVNGNPLELMRENGRRFYFDQDAVLTERFGILNVPAVVERAYPFMRVTEIPVGGGD